jgi:hypothetical protein
MGLKQLYDALPPEILKEVLAKLVTLFELP